MQPACSVLKHKGNCKRTPKFMLVVKRTPKFMLVAMKAEQLTVYTYFDISELHALLFYGTLANRSRGGLAWGKDCKHRHHFSMLKLYIHPTKH